MDIPDVKAFLIPDSFREVKSSIFLLKEDSCDRYFPDERVPKKKRTSLTIPA